MMKTLKNPPYLQLAIDTPELLEVRALFSEISDFPQLLLEIGTPLLKYEGLRYIGSVFRNIFPNAYLIADLKTLDVGELEVSLTARVGINACVVSGLAPVSTINEFLMACVDYQIDGWIDSLGMNNIQIREKLRQLSYTPKVLIVHRGIDEEKSGISLSSNIVDLKGNYLLAIAGGLTLNNISSFRCIADIFIIGRAIYHSQSPSKMIQQFYSTITKHL